MSASPPSSSKSLREPGPDHPIAIAPYPHRVVARLDGRVLADSHSALALSEAGHAEVLYIPRADVDMGQLTRLARATFCPYKGDCSYYGRAGDGAGAEPLAWSYEAPGTRAAAPIAGFIAFYRDRVEWNEERAG